MEFWPPLLEQKIKLVLKDKNNNKVTVTTGRPNITGGELSALIWAKSVGIFADRGDGCKDRFHMKALIFARQKQKVFDEKVQIEYFKNAASYSNTIKENGGAEQIQGLS